MVAESLYIVNSFLTDIFQKLPFSRIKTACKHEILPDKDAVAVTKFIEYIFFIDTASPDAEHIHVDISCIEDSLFILFPRDTWQEVILWNVISAFGKDRNSVQFYIKSLSILIRLVNNLKRAQADFLSLSISRTIIDGEVCAEIVQILFAQTITPPQFRVPDRER